MIRKLFVGEIVSEIPMGTSRSGIRRVQQTALITRRGSRPRLYLERVARIGPLTGGVEYVHLPDDGLDTLERVGQAVARGLPPVRPRLRDRLARAVLFLSGLPVNLAFVAFFAAWATMLLSILTCGFGGRMDYSIFERVGPAPMIAWVAWMFGAFLSQWAVLWTLSKLYGERVATTIVRYRLGSPGPVHPMGTWQGPLGESAASRGISVWLQVLAARGSESWLVVTRSHQSLLSSRVAVYATPAAQVPALLEAVSAYRELLDGA